MKVGPEKTFQSVVIGLVTFIHAAYLLYIVKQGKADSTILDKMEGMGYMIILMLLITAVFWGSQRVLEQDFIIHGNTTEGGGGGTALRVSRRLSRPLAEVLATRDRGDFGTPF